MVDASVDALVKPNLVLGKLLLGGQCHPMDWNPHRILSMLGRGTHERMNA